MCVLLGVFRRKIPFILSLQFSQRIWQAVLSQCLVSDPPTDWDEILEKGMKECRGNGLKAVLIRLSLSASVYAIWKERNNIHYGNNLLTEEDISKD
jgi:hypothetical protein